MTASLVRPRNAVAVKSQHSTRSPHLLAFCSYCENELVLTEQEILQQEHDIMCAGCKIERELF